MNKTLLNPLKDYGYPETVLKVISKFVDIVLDVFNDEGAGVLLVGSASRGELCWGNLEERLILFSDIEFMVAVNSESHNQKKELNQRINELSDSYDLGERFHLDYVVNRWSKLKSLQKKIFIFDCKNTGIDLTEQQLKDYLPEVEKKNLDFKELNDVLLHRMKALVADIPNDLLKDRNTHRDFMLSIAKNTLDITTWLYPYEADKLLSGFEARLDDWDKRKDGMQLARYFTEDDFLFLRECLNIRKSPSIDCNELILLKKYVAIYEKAIDYCKKMNSINSVADIDSHFVSAKLFQEFQLRRRLAEMYNIYRNYKIFSVSNIFSNAFLPRKGKQVNFCLDIIKAIIENADSCSENVDSNYIFSARKKLNSLRKVSTTNDECVADSLNSIRNDYLVLNNIFI